MYRCSRTRWIILTSPSTNGCKKNYILLNTSRGKVVDLEAVFSALKGGKLMGAGLDVLPAEPLSALNGAEKRLVKDMLAMPQVILTPHTAGYSREALYKVSKALLGKIVTLR